jgi:hypothetical protein
LTQGSVASGAIEGSGGSAAAATPRLRALFLLRSSNDDAVFRSLLSAMHTGGHEVLVFDQTQLPPRRGVWPIVAGAVRRSLDYLRYLESERTDASGPDPLRDQARDRAPRSLRVLLFLPPFGWRSGPRPLGRLLRRLEAGIPLPRRIKSFISDQAPDVVLVSPLVEFDYPGGDFLRTAEAARIPTVLVATSRDELTSQGVIRDMPIPTVVSNEQLVDESVEAIERTARAEVAPRREGRLLRPLLWLLTPLVAIVLAILRPRATFRAVSRAVRRLRKRIRKWAGARRRGRKERRAEGRKAQVMATQEEEQARAQEKRARAQEKQAGAQAKRQAKAHAAALKAEKRARREAKRKEREARTERRQEREEAGG